MSLTMGARQSHGRCYGDAVLHLGQRQFVEFPRDGVTFPPKSQLTARFRLPMVQVRSPFHHLYPSRKPFTAGCCWDGVAVDGSDRNNVFCSEYVTVRTCSMCYAVRSNSMRGQARAWSPIC